MELSLPSSPAAVLDPLAATNLTEVDGAAIRSPRRHSARSRDIASTHRAPEVNTLLRRIEQRRTRTDAYAALLRNPHIIFNESYDGSGLEAELDAQASPVSRANSFYEHKSRMLSASKFRNLINGLHAYSTNARRYLDISRAELIRLGDGGLQALLNMRELEEFEGTLSEQMALGDDTEVTRVSLRRSVGNGPERSLGDHLEEFVGNLEPSNEELEDSSQSRLTEDRAIGTSENAEEFVNASELMNNERQSNVSKRRSYQPTNNMEEFVGNLDNLIEETVESSSQSRSENLLPENKDSTKESFSAVEPSNYESRRDLHNHSLQGDENDAYAHTGFTAEPSEQIRKDVETGVESLHEVSENFMSTGVTRKAMLSTSTRFSGFGVSAEPSATSKHREASGAHEGGISNMHRDPVPATPPQRRIMVAEPRTEPVRRNVRQSLGISEIRSTSYNIAFSSPRAGSRQRSRLSLAHEDLRPPVITGPVPSAHENVPTPSSSDVTTSSYSNDVQTSTRSLGQRSLSPSVLVALPRRSADKLGSRRDSTPVASPWRGSSPNSGDDNPTRAVLTPNHRQSTSVHLSPSFLPGAESTRIARHNRMSMDIPGQADNPAADVYYQIKKTMQSSTRRSPAASTSQRASDPSARIGRPRPSIHDSFDVGHKDHPRSSKRSIRHSVREQSDLEEEGEALIGTPSKSRLESPAVNHLFARTSLKSVRAGEMSNRRSDTDGINNSRLRDGEVQSRRSAAAEMSIRRFFADDSRNRLSDAAERSSRHRRASEISNRRSDAEEINDTRPHAGEERNRLSGVAQVSSRRSFAGESSRRHSNIDDTINRHSGSDEQSSRRSHAGEKGSRHSDTARPSTSNVWMSRNTEGSNSAGTIPRRLRQATLLERFHQLVPDFENEVAQQQTACAPRRNVRRSAPTPVKSSLFKLKISDHMNYFKQALQPLRLGGDVKVDIQEAFSQFDQLVHRQLSETAGDEPLRHNHVLTLLRRSGVATSKEQLRRKIVQFLPHDSQRKLIRAVYSAHVIFPEPDPLTDDSD